MLVREHDRGRASGERERGDQEEKGVATVKPRPEYSFAVCCFNNTRNPSSNFQNFNPMSLIRLPTLHSPPSPPRSSQLHSQWFVCCILPFCCCCCNTSCCCCCGLLQCWWWVDLISHVGIIDSSFCAAPPPSKRSAKCRMQVSLAVAPPSLAASPSLSLHLIPCSWGPINPARLQRNHPPVARSCFNAKSKRFEYIFPRFGSRNAA